MRKFKVNLIECLRGRLCFNRGKRSLQRAHILSLLKLGVLNMHISLWKRRSDAEGIQIQERKNEN